MMWRLFRALDEVFYWLQGPRGHEWRPAWLALWAYRRMKATERACTDWTGRTIYGERWR